MAGKAIVYWHDKKAGVLSEQDDGYVFQYAGSYIGKKDAQAISFTLPLRTEPFVSKTMFPFFDGLIPEGWLLDVVADIWKLDPRDRMGLLMTCCRDCIGAVSIIPDEEDVQ